MLLCGLKQRRQRTGLHGRCHMAHRVVAGDSQEDASHAGQDDGHLLLEGPLPVGDSSHVSVVTAPHKCHSQVLHSPHRKLTLARTEAEAHIQEEAQLFTSW